MAQLRQDYEQLKAQDAEVIVIGPEDAAAFGREWEKEAFPSSACPIRNTRSPIRTGRKCGCCGWDGCLRWRWWTNGAHRHAASRRVHGDIVTTGRAGRARRSGGLTESCRFRV
ncbi:MAG: hypothetical protein R2838_00750 [Caldilineaceae bacterium]